MLRLRAVMSAIGLIFVLVSPTWAQVTNSFSCVATVALPTTVRSEGSAELTGDLILSCSGELSSPSTAVFQIFVNGADVTSRIINVDGVALSEALLLIDEPNTGFPGSLPLSLCTTPTSIGCNGLNAIPGVVSSNSITFLGVPITPKDTITTYVYRITNIRANASGVVLPPGIPGQLQASVSIGGSVPVPVANPTLVVGFVLPGLNFSVRDAAAAAPLGSGIALDRCVSNDKVRIATLRFAENFPTAFKLRATGMQDTPAVIYNTESGLIVPALSGTDFVPGGGPALAGLADFGTRVKATFVNVPAGVRVFVGAQDLGATPRLTLNASEAGPFAPVATQLIDGLPAAEVSVVNGTAVAVYEVTTTNPFAVEFADVPVWISYNAGIPPVAQAPATVSGSFAPTSTSASWTLGSATLPIPRFLDNSAAQDLFRVAGCEVTITFDTTLADIASSLQQGLIDSPGIAGALSSHLRSSAAAAARGQTKAAVNTLNAFEHLVKAQAGKHIHPSAASLLLQDAAALINQLTP